MSETGEGPSVVTAAVEELVADPTTETPTSPILPNTDAEADSSDTRTDTETENAPELDPRLQAEPLFLGSTLLSRKTKDGLRDADAAPSREAFLDATPHVKILRDLDYVSKLKPADFKEGSTVPLDKGGTTYTIDGHVLSAIDSYDGENFMCRVVGSTERVPVPPKKLLATMAHDGRNQILKNFPEGSKERAFMEVFLTMNDPFGDGLTEEQISELPNLTKEAGKNVGFPTTDDLIEMAQTYFAASELDNADELLTELRSKLANHSLASPDEMQEVFELCGMNTENLTKTAQKISENIAELEKRKASTEDKAEQAQIQNEIDIAKDAVANIQEGLRALSKEGNYIQAYYDKLMAGDISQETALAVMQAAKTLDPESLILLINAEQTKNMTPEELKAAQEKRNQIDKYLKGIGITGGLLALLIAMGILTGAKQ